MQDKICIFKNINSTMSTGGTQSNIPQVNIQSSIEYTRSLQQQ